MTKKEINVYNSFIYREFLANFYLKNTKSVEKERAVFNDKKH
jgi:hypothetical protein